MSERTLALTFIGVTVVETIDEIVTVGVPRPSRYFGTVIAFGMLGGLAAVGPSEARLAAALGGLFLGAVVLTRSPVLISVFNIANRGPNPPAGGSGGSTSGSSGPAPPVGPLGPAVPGLPSAGARQGGSSDPSAGRPPLLAPPQ